MCLAASKNGINAVLIKTAYEREEPTKIKIDRSIQSTLLEEP